MSAPRRDANLPGEDTPLPMRYLGAPITDAEALGVARRHARRRPAATVPEELPEEGAALILTTVKLHPRAAAFARARAEMENLTLSDIVRAAVESYAFDSPGTATVFQPRR